MVTDCRVQSLQFCGTQFFPKSTSHRLWPVLNFLSYILVFVKRIQLCKPVLVHINCSAYELSFKSDGVMLKYMWGFLSFEIPENGSRRKHVYFFCH